MSEALTYFLMAWTDPGLLALVAAGTFAGIYVGAIPGLSVTMAAAILISFTFRWEVNEALALIAGVFMGGVYGGSRSAILLNIPGAPSAMATAFDGFPLAQRGEAGPAIGLSTVMSFVGGLVGIVDARRRRPRHLRIRPAVCAPRLSAPRPDRAAARRQPVG